MKKACPPTRRGFALIYVLLFVVLLLIAVSATWFTGMADLRLSQRSQYSVQATQLAKAGIDDAWLKYKDEIGNLLTIPSVIFPPTAGGIDACTDPNPLVRRTQINDDGTLSVVNPDPRLQNSVNLAPNGVYDYKICSTAGAPYPSTTIEGIGYYKGSKITLKANVNYNPTAIMGPDPANPGGQIQTGWNHTNDYLTIYQSGPSK